MTAKKAFRPAALCLFIFSILIAANFFFGSSAQSTRLAEFDVRGPQGVPKGTALRPPTLAQLKALNALQGLTGNTVQVRYNGLTGTPRHMFSHSAYLSPPSTAEPESIARGFVSRNRELFRFSDEDLNSLRLKSRAYVPDTGTTIMQWTARNCREPWRKSFGQRAPL